MGRLELCLRRLREARGLSQVELAKLADIRQATISDLESGKSRGITFDVLERIAVALKAEPGQLFKRTAFKRRRT
jgi:transcriptional regulator with XRE-family HTH domain